MSYTNSSCSYHPCKSSYSSSSLERIVGSYNTSSSSYDSGNVSYMKEQPVMSQQLVYEEKDAPKLYNHGYSTQKSRTMTYSPVVSCFLNPDRPLTPFIGDASKIKEFVEEAFYHTTGKQFPKDIIVHVLSDKEFERMHRNRFDFSIRGFAINRKPFGFSEVFARQDCIDGLMVVLGHEIGHVLTEKLSTARDEEAKAFAFCIAWLRAIKEHNVANLSRCIRLGKPAENGIHDKAFEFVDKLMMQGLSPLEIFYDVSNDEMRVDSCV